jgi:hypothetical protein
MKYIAATILLLLMLTQTFSKWMFVLEYELNQKFIADKLCVNKAKPSLHCNGKCYLAKKMITDEQPQPGSQKTPVFKFVELNYVAPAIEGNNFAPAISSALTSSRYISFEYESPVDDIFHPPASSLSLI